MSSRTANNRDRRASFALWQRLVCAALVCLSFLVRPARSEPAGGLPPEPADLLAANVSDLAEQEVVPEGLEVPLGVDVPDGIGGPECDWQTGCAPPGRSLFADVLYWTARAGGAENWAEVITPIGDGASAGSARLIDAPFEWNAGLRVGIARNRAGDDYDARLYYTHFNTRGANRASGEVYSAFLGNFYVGNIDGLGFGPHYRRASIEWDIQFHTIDFELGRTLTIDESLALRPFVGLKAAIIDHAVSSRWQDPIDADGQVYLFDLGVEDLRQDFWGIGPSIGVTMTIPWRTAATHTLSIYGTPSAALLFGQWRFKDHYQSDGLTSLAEPYPASITIQSSPITGASTMFRGEIGVQWTRAWARATTTVRLGYEAQVWLNQMQLYILNMGRLNNLMSLQGGVLELGINY
jgi:hypothetical protein